MNFKFDIRLITRRSKWAQELQFSCSYMRFRWNFSWCFHIMHISKAE